MYLYLHLVSFSFCLKNLWYKFFQLLHVQRSLYLLLYLKIFLLCIRRRPWHPTPVLLPGEFHRQRSLVGCSPWGCKESDTTEPLSMAQWPREGSAGPPQRASLKLIEGGAWQALLGEQPQGQDSCKFSLPVQISRGEVCMDFLTHLRKDRLWDYPHRIKFCF